MNRNPIMLVAVLGLSLFSQIPAAADDPIRESYIDLLSAFQVVWMHDQERLAMDLNQAFYDDWGEPLFASIAASKPRYMERLSDLVDWYDIRFYGPISDTPGAYMDERHATAADDLLYRGRQSLEAAYLAAAYVEEWNISEYSNDTMAIELGECWPCEGMQLLNQSYEGLLLAANINFANLASQVDDYQAQILSQAEVDAILEQAWEPPEAHFVINGGLTDVWYNPATSGQGFFISIFEKKASAFLSWLTFDTAPPEAGVTAHLGHPCQRWLTAQGSYEGAQAELVVYSSSGGLFDAATPAPAMETVGTILLEFEDCNNGNVTYDLPGIGESGSMPIVRLASDNAVVCKVMTPVVP